MKIAICLHGLSHSKNDKGHVVSYKEGLKNFKKNVVTSDTDVFFHTWNPDILTISEDFQASKGFGEEQKIFDEQLTKDGKRTMLHSIRSRWLSALKSVALMEEWQKTHNIKYDLVMLVRFDIIFKVNVPWNDLDAKKFWTAKWEDEGGHSLDKDCVLDLWFISSPEMMIEFSKLYEKIDEYLSKEILLSNHVLAMTHLRMLKYDGKIDKWGKNPHDFDLIRRFLRETDK